MKRHKYINAIISLLVLSLVILSGAIVEGAMTDYCIVPPFISQSIPPNIMILLDNSLSMSGQAYAGNFDPSQFVSGTYYGYFDPTKNYRYNGSRWEVTLNPMNTGTVANPIASGNLLNWATMERVEVAKKLLIGGKANPRSWNGAVTVKLNAESNGSFDKDFDNTLVPNAIFPFLGNYRYDRSGDSLTVAPVNPASNTDILRPVADVVASAAWVPNAGALRWERVDENPADNDTTYIQNTTTNNNDQVIFSYGAYVPTIAGSISDVTVVVRARKGSSQTRRLQGVVRIKSAGVDVDYFSNYSNLSTSYQDYQFSWATNPATGLAWTFADLTGNANGSLQGFGIKAYTNPNASNYIRATQVYLIVTVTNPTGGPYNIIVDLGPGEDATGIVDTLTGDVRFGLSYYAGSNNGAKVDQYVDFLTATNMITSISNLVPSTYTPLGETLYELTRHFRQELPYYGNAPADYQTGLQYDPFYYQYSNIIAGASDIYVPCAKSFVLFLTDGESTQDTSIPPAIAAPGNPCTLTNIKGCSQGYRFAGTPVGTSYAINGTDYLIDVAFWARTNDLRPGGCETTKITPTVWDKCLPGVQNLNLYPVFMFGKGSTLLKDAAIDGGFNDLNDNNRPDCLTAPKECYRDTDEDGIVESNGQDDPLTYYEGDDGYELERSIKAAIAEILKRTSSGTAASVLASGEGSGANMIQAIFYPRKTTDSLDNTELSWMGTLQNYWFFVDPKIGRSSIREDSNQDSKLSLSVDKIADFRFDTADQRTKADLFSSDDAGNRGLLLSTIFIEDVKNLWEAGKALWVTDPAGRKFFTNTTAYTNPPAQNNMQVDFSTASPSIATIRTLLRIPTSGDAATDVINANRIVDYVRGTDSAGLRSRTTKLDLNGDGDTSDAGESAKVWKLGDIVSSTPKITSWLPFNRYDVTYDDQTYKQFTGQAAYPDPSDPSNSIYRSGYRSRGTVFVGANDGMLHALNLGVLDVVDIGGTTAKAKLCDRSEATYSDPNSDGDGRWHCPDSITSKASLGKEQWAFIPKNVLPYLQYLADPDYCHLYYVDATPYIVDASVGISSGCSETSDYWKCEKKVDSWRTILIGSMRQGGACKDPASASTRGIKAPAAGEGFSSYFALDITDAVEHPDNIAMYPPKLLWEFTDPDLGLSTVVPSIVKLNWRTVSAGKSQVAIPARNGKWYVVLASGATGPIDTTKQQFKAYSDQNLRLYVLDLQSGKLLRKIDTGVTNAFASSLAGAASDLDLDYQDDLLYVGYTRAENNPIGAATAWTQGGVLRLLTKEDLDGDNPDPVAGNTGLNPANWEVSKVFQDDGPGANSVNAGAVSTSIAHRTFVPRGLPATEPEQAWLFFGTGRYYFSGDDLSSQQRMYGMQDKCFDRMIDTKTTSGGNAAAQICRDPEEVTAFCQGAAVYCTLGNPTCQCGDLYNSTVRVDMPSKPENPSPNVLGWYINLESPTNTQVDIDPSHNHTDSNIKPSAERVLTDPVTTSLGGVFFTTFIPSNDVCKFGGETFLWGLTYNMGSSYVASLFKSGATLAGKGYMQVSTGEIVDIDFASQFSASGAKYAEYGDSFGASLVDKAESHGRRAGGGTGGGISGMPPSGQGLSIQVPPPGINRVMHLRKK